MDWNSILNFVPSLIGSSGGLISSHFNRKQQERQYQEQFDFARSQFDYQKDINAWAQQMQERQFGMEQQRFGMEQQRMTREDNAYQRMVADLQSAGLNKNIALGQGGAPAMAGGNVGGNAGGMRLSANAGQAPDSVRMSPMEQAFYGAQIGKMFSEIAVDNAMAKKMDREAQSIDEYLDLDTKALALQERITRVSEGELTELIVSNNIKMNELEKYVEIEEKKLEQKSQELQMDKQRLNSDLLTQQSLRDLQKLEGALKQAQERLTNSQAEISERDLKILSEGTATQGLLSTQLTGSTPSIITSLLDNILSIITRFGNNTRR